MISSILMCVRQTKPSRNPTGSMIPGIRPGRGRRRRRRGRQPADGGARSTRTAPHGGACCPPGTIEVGTGPRNQEPRTRKLTALTSSQGAKNMRPPVIVACNWGCHEYKDPRTRPLSQDPRFIPGRRRCCGSSRGSTSGTSPGRRWR